MTTAISGWRTDAYQRFDAATRIPLLILSVALIPILLWPEVNGHVSHSTTTALNAADYGIWAAFLVEYVTKVSLAPRRWHFVKTHIPDLLLVVIPFLRPLRLLRSARALRAMRLTRLVAVAVEGSREASRSLASRAVTYALVIAALMLLVISAVILDAERGAAGSNIHTFGDAIWWSIVTLTTVGYGDHYPVTAMGKTVASVLLVSGVALLAVITAGFASWFVSHHQAAEESHEDAERNLLVDQIKDLRAQIGTLTDTVAALASRLPSGTADELTDEASLPR